MPLTSFELTYNALFLDDSKYHCEQSFIYRLPARNNEQEFGQNQLECIFKL